MANEFQISSLTELFDSLGDSTLYKLPLYKLAIGIYNSVSGTVFWGRPFVKRFALCYLTIVCLSCPVCDFGALWTNGWTDQYATWYGGRPRPRRHCVRWGSTFPSPKRGDRGPPPQFSAHVTYGTQLPLSKRGRPHPRFSAHVSCGQTAGWMKTPLGMEVDLGPGHIVLDGVPALSERGTAPPPSFRPMCNVATVAHLSY